MNQHSIIFNNYLAENFATTRIAKLEQSRVAESRNHVGRGGAVVGADGGVRPEFCPNSAARMIKQAVAVTRSA